MRAAKIETRKDDGWTGPRLWVVARQHQPRAGLPEAALPHAAAALARGRPSPSDRRARTASGSGSAGTSTGSSCVCSRQRRLRRLWRGCAIGGARGLLHGLLVVLQRRSAPSLEASGYGCTAVERGEWTQPAGGDSSL